MPYFIHTYVHYTVGYTVWYVYRASLVTPHIDYYVEYGNAVHGFRVHPMTAAIGAIDTSRV